MGTAQVARCSLDTQHRWVDVASTQRLSVAAASLPPLAVSRTFDMRDATGEWFHLTGSGGRGGCFDADLTTSRPCTSGADELERRRQDFQMHSGCSHPIQDGRENLSKASVESQRQQQQQQQQQHQQHQHQLQQRQQQEPVPFQLLQQQRQQRQTEASVATACTATWVFPQYGNRQVLSDYEMGMPLGRGSYGTTAMVMHRRTAAAWACKTISKGSAPSRRRLQQLRSEVSVLQHLAGVPGVVQLADVYEDTRNVHLVMELCRGGELLADLQRHGGRYCEHKAAAVTRVILTALQRCHAAGAMHRDIKPEHFLLVAPADSSAGTRSHSSAGTCCRSSSAMHSCCDSMEPCCSSEPLLKLTDFGSATFFQPGQTFSEVVGTAAYAAPELLAGAYTEACDVWSAGVVLYLLLSGSLPFDGSTDEQVIQAVLHTEVDLNTDVWQSVSPSAKALVGQMLCKDPRARLSACELLQHPWLRQHQALKHPRRADQRGTPQQQQQQQQHPQQQQQQAEEAAQPRAQHQQAQEQQAPQAQQQLQHVPEQHEQALQLLKQASGAMASASTWSACGAMHRPLVHVTMAVQCRNM